MKLSRGVVAFFLFCLMNCVGCGQDASDRDDVGNDLNSKNEAFSNLSSFAHQVVPSLPKDFPNDLFVHESAKIKTVLFLKEKVRVIWMTPPPFELILVSYLEGMDQLGWVRQESVEHGMIHELSWTLDGRLVTFKFTPTSAGGLVEVVYDRQSL